jgi:glutathione synthase
LDSNGDLYVDINNQLIHASVVYYRAGYTPNDYPSEVEWTARELVERSSALKCPNVGYHLAGTKAIQAALCKPGVLEKYLDNNDECALLRKCFAQQYSLGDPDVQEEAKMAVEEAIKDGHKWVLKPQREGGGNNYYHETLSTFLQEHLNQPTLSGIVAATVY